MPVRKVRLKDGSVGYQWGTTGKIYRKREDAEKQGIAILLSQRKKRKMKLNKELYNELKAKVESLEKQINGGKGSGNFGHSGRPGRIGGSAPEGSGGSPKSEDSSRAKRNKENIEKAREYASEASRGAVELADREAAEFLGADLSDSGIEKGDRKDFWDSVVAQLETKEESSDSTKKEIKGDTKAEKAKIKSLLEFYADEERGFEGILEDAKAGGRPSDSNYQKALYWVEGGGAGISYYDAYQDLKAIYGDNFKPETYLTKGGNEDNGDWKYKDGEPYVWTIYKAKLAKVIADEMEGRKK